MLLRILARSLSPSASEAAVLLLLLILGSGRSTLISLILAEVSLSRKLVLSLPLDSADGNLLERGRSNERWRDNRTRIERWFGQLVIERTQVQ